MNTNHGPHTKIDYSIITTELDDATRAIGRYEDGDYEYEERAHELILESIAHSLLSIAHSLTAHHFDDLYPTE